MYYNQYQRDGRYGGFLAPFLLGGLVGGGAVAVSRPRPIIANSYPPMPPRPPYGQIPNPRPPYPPYFF